MWCMEIKSHKIEKYRINATATPYTLGKCDAIISCTTDHDYV